MKIVATTSLPAVNRPNADRWNAARSRQKQDCEITKECQWRRIQQYNLTNIFLAKTDVIGYWLLGGMVPFVLLSLHAYNSKAVNPRLIAKS